MIYLDNSATTQPASDVVSVMQDVMADIYGNPSSLHGIGLKAEKLLEQAREVAAQTLGVRASEIVFTSGGTEGNNLAIKGTAFAYRDRGRHIITTEVEHPSVYQACEQLKHHGFIVTVLSPDSNGRISVEKVKRALRDDTILVSIMHANNEIGTVNPIMEIGDMLKSRPKTLFHVDAVQGFGKIPLPSRLEGIDILTVSGHKLHGPKGTGLTYIRSGVTVKPLLAGGGQEGGYRSGTENVPGIVGLARSMKTSMDRIDKHRQLWMKAKCDAIESLRELTDCKINGDLTSTGGAPHILSVSFPDLKGEVLVHSLEEREVYVSTRSACSSKQHVPSRVLAACGLTANEAEGTLRISMGQQTTHSELGQAVGIIKETVKKLRQEMSVN